MMYSCLNSVNFPSIRVGKSCSELRFNVNNFLTMLCYLQEPSWSPSLLGLACARSTHQDHWTPWKDCRCVQEAIIVHFNSAWRDPLAHVRTYVSNSIVGPGHAYWSVCIGSSSFERNLCSRTLQLCKSLDGNSDMWHNSVFWC